jgi:hypothetical protein
VKERKVRNDYILLAKNLREGALIGDIGVDGRILLKWILKNNACRKFLKKMRNLELA